MEAFVYEEGRGSFRGSWMANPNIGRPLTAEECGELKHRNALHITPEDLPGTAEYEARQKWIADKPQRDAEEKRKRDLAAQQAERARRAQNEAVISSVHNDYPGISVERRTRINTGVFSEPTKNYILSGPGGVGKTTMLVALAKLARISGKRVLMTDGMTWETDVRSNTFADFEDKRALPISAEGLVACSPCFVGFDELDKLKKDSEWLMNHLHALIETVRRARHQLVMTTNLDKDAFRLHIGESLVWRLLQAPETNGRGGLGCVWVDFSNKGS